MTEEVNLPSIERFEQAVLAREYETACVELLFILEKLDSNFGSIWNIKFSMPNQLLNENLDQERVEYFATRMANIITTLFTDANLNISDAGTVRFLTLQRWLNMIFAASPFINADHILQTYNRHPNPVNPSVDFHLDNASSALNKFVILYLPESNIDVSLDALWNLNPSLTASLCFALQSPRFIGTDAAFRKRAKILQWFPEKLAQIENLNHLPSGISHDVYMHCSYDTAPNKHSVKKSLNQVIRRHILALGWQDRDVKQIGYRNGKPVMLVLLEHFHASHSIYRTHSTSMVAAREHFYLIGLGGTAVDEAGRAVFDEFHVLGNDSILDKMNFVRNIAEENGASIFYMPSIGMDLLPIFLSNTRITPIQVIALGHPATTHSEFIEYVIVEDDYVGSEACFSETLLRLPKDALPYVPSASTPKKINYLLRENPDIVQIGVASTTMKLNPYFLAACREIINRAKVKIHFHFALGQSNGITHPYVERFIRSYLGENATAHQHQPYERYLETLRQCDMLINPFPFGNTNGIIDMVTLGLVGVCKTGDEVHEHIDEGLFKRLGLPEWLVTQTVDDYVDCAVRLAENHEERLDLRRHIIENNGLQTLFTGDARPMGQILLAKWQEWAVNHGIDLEHHASSSVETEVSIETAEPQAVAETETKTKEATAELIENKVEAENTTPTESKMKTENETPAKT